MTASQKHIDVDAVKLAVVGRENETLAAVCGFGIELLDGKHHDTCPKCGTGTNRFRAFKDGKGGTVCSGCNPNGSGDVFASIQWFKDCDFMEAVNEVASYLNIHPSSNGKPKRSAVEVLEAIAREKKVSASALVVYGAKVSGDTGYMPMYDPRGKQCSTCAMNGKGRNQKGKTVGVFLPHVKATKKPHLPKPGETSYLVEGWKDTPALWQLSTDEFPHHLLAVGLPGSSLPERFAPMFTGVHVVIVPDRDRAGENGANRTAAVLRGHAASTKVATLPAEWKETGGDGVREVLTKTNGEQLVRDALAAAKEWEPTRGLILIDPENKPVSEVVEAVTNCLLSGGELFNRTGQPVIIRRGSITPILSSRQLSGIINEFSEVVVVTLTKDGEKSHYKPLPTDYANVWLNRISEFEKLPIVRLFTRNPVYTADFRLAEVGFDADSGIYYDGQPITPADDTKHLDELLQDFCFKAPGDRTNYIGMLLTCLMISKFIGSKPAVVFNGNQPELGKSILAQIIAIVRDGAHVETATFNANDEEFEKRLGSIVRRGNTTIIVDNAKARGRTITIESAVLERSITDPILSFRLLGGSSDIRCENSHIFCITANTPEISRDLITRSILVNLHHEGNPTARTFNVVDPEGYAIQYRDEILAELCGMVERWKAAGMPLASTQSRFNKKGWGNIIGGILAANGEPDFLTNASEAAEQMDAARREFGELVEAMAKHPQGTWTSAELVSLAQQNGLLSEELGDKSARSKSTRMGVLTTRYVAERFELEGSAVATFRQRDGRKNTLHFVEVEGNDDF